MPAVALLPFFLPTCYHRVNPHLSLSPSFARRASPLPFTLLPSVNLASCLHFKLMDLPRKDKEGERRQIYIYREKEKKKRGKQVKRPCRLCLTYTLIRKRGFVYFFSQPVHESSLQQAKFSMKFSVARTWTSTFEIHTSTDTNARGLLCESRLRGLGYKGRGGVRARFRRKIVERFLNERRSKFVLQSVRSGEREVRFFEGAHA